MELTDLNTDSVILWFCEYNVVQIYPSPLWRDQCVCCHFLCCLECASISSLLQFEWSLGWTSVFTKYVGQHITEKLCMEICTRKVSINTI